MKKLSFAALALTLFAAGAIAFAPHAEAQTAPRFMTVDAVALAQPLAGSIGFTITGVAEGQAASSSASVSFTAQDPFAAQKFEACERLLLLALSKPGQYVFRLGAGSGHCAVALVAP